MTDSKTTTRWFEAALIETLPRNEFGITPAEALEQRLLCVTGVAGAEVAPPVDEDGLLYWVTIVRRDGYDRSTVLGSVEEAIMGPKCCPKVEENLFDEDPIDDELIETIV